LPVRRWSLVVAIVAVVLALVAVQPASANNVEEDERDVVQDSHNVEDDEQRGDDEQDGDDEPSVEEALLLAGDQASIALQHVTQARAAYGEATSKAQEVRLRLGAARAELAKAQTRVESTREQLRDYVGALFRGGSSFGAFEPLLTADDPTDFINRAGLLEVTNTRQAEVLADLTAERARADKLAEETAQLANDLTALETEAAEALAATEAAMSQAEALVARLRHEVASRDAARLAAVIAATTGERTLVLPGFPVDGGSCGGGSVAGYPNGRIPTRLLCPLWGAPGMSMRADAADAFNRLSQEYADRFGVPICVIDSYRSYDQQVSVKAARGSLAATPGTSNHGWGLAVDLCGGIERFGTAEHRWMRENAPPFGYFHPDWAQRGGSKPEPWHWEFAGVIFDDE
jgi:hypothetical protein